MPRPNSSLINEPSGNAMLCATELIAVLVSIVNDVPCVITLGNGQSLPFGPLMIHHHSLQKGMQNWVYKQTGIKLGHTEQLYTFTDRLDDKKERPPNVRISYMAVLPHASLINSERQSFYAYFPWEDRRNGEILAPLRKAYKLLQEWAGEDSKRRQRVSDTFGNSCDPWNDELVLSRYELLWEAGLLPESRHRREFVMPGQAMPNDFRRILATALSRLRSKIRYKPVIFDFLGPEFTLLELQKTMEALTGRGMRKQNFRRLVLQQKLVKETENYVRQGQGRPARLYKVVAQNSGLCNLATANLPLDPL